MTDSVELEKTHVEQYMKQVNDCKDSIFKVQAAWDNLSLLAQLSGIGTDMKQTRDGFSQLTNELMNSLSVEVFHKTINHLTSKAAVTINLIVRNLFERTADIGFLATDTNVRNCLMGHIDGRTNDDSFVNLKARFLEYINKYSVYSDVVLLDVSGSVLVRANDSSAVSHSCDPLINEALTTGESYVEVYRHMDLFPNQEKSLVYAYRVCAKDSNQAIGVLCLCFKFEDELDTLFNQLIKPNDWTVGTLLDDEYHVISTSDRHQIPVGAKLEVSAEEQGWVLTRFAGREYLAVTQKTLGYQGYMGPGWMGHMLIPLQHAFASDLTEKKTGINTSLLLHVMRNPQLFSQQLLRIPKQAASIQSRLNRSVWNGNVWQAKQSDVRQNSFSKTLLWEISSTGFSTQKMIEATVANLYQTILLDLLDSLSFSAFLAVDIMDRNLYERANDCRWWALTATFREILSKSATSIDAEDLNELRETLAYINGLYTVYDNLFIFDQQGKILAVSNDQYQQHVGKLITGRWITEIKATKTSQDYVVSSFEPSDLYDGKYTYIYAAAIRSDQNSSILGGIGVVFDSQPQFKSMLDDIMPKDASGRIVDGSFTLFVDGNSKIVSSSTTNLEVGGLFNIPSSFSRLTAGESGFDIVSYQQHYYAVGACVSSGYREYKRANDRYENKITAMAYVPLGEVEKVNAMMSVGQEINKKQVIYGSNYQTASSKEFATFYVGGQWFGLPAESVVEALDQCDIRSIPDTFSSIEGVVQYQGNVIPVINLGKLMGIVSLGKADDMQLVVIEANQNKSLFAVLVEKLGEIPSVDTSKIESVANIFNSNNMNLAIGVISMSINSDDTKMLTILSAENIPQKSNLRLE